MTSDINHPRTLPLQWRGEADRLTELFKADSPAYGQVSARVLTLRQCAGELENRLRWSGMLDP